ncbi:MAG TPA: DUF5931 domain-containing protein [Segeticoccus sp.]|uniref:MacS family sensor histidine kinase n=1 Tax=Segeticoccus sp. TaxID=2706531 RepID=UPI002D80DF64|nr:DUF5931 domain-containing protein [Segeticoccus sp.]HET8600301.1 DUF5931 domain-containing protein [Segeticoccus sp.]
MALIPPAATAPPAGPPVVSAMWRAVDVLRPLTLAWAAWSVFHRQAALTRPWLAWVVLAVLAAWTVAMFFVRRRGWRLATAEVALACAAILLTRLVDTPEAILSGEHTLPGTWPAAGVLAWAVLAGWRGGLAAAACVGLVDLVEIGTPTSHTVDNIVLLLLAGICVGYCADLARSGHAALQRALELQARVRERERLARTVHDGVLQTLAYIHRRGRDLGGAAAELGTMAADQELLLRSLVSGVAEEELERQVAGPVDLRDLLRRFVGATVQLVPPAEPVLLPRRVADELAAAVGAVLDNVHRHAGPGARAWVLVEDDGPWVRVTVRDDGQGMAEGRLAEAAAIGRMGVASSVRGRVADLGGQATYRSVPGRGTTVELEVPRSAGTGEEDG